MLLVGYFLLSATIYTDTFLLGTCIHLHLSPLFEAEKACKVIHTVWEEIKRDKPLVKMDLTAINWYCNSLKYDFYLSVFT